MKKRLITDYLMAFLLTLVFLSVSGCSRDLSKIEEEDKKEKQLQLSWQENERGAEIYYGNPSDTVYQISQLPFPTFWGGASYSIITPSGDLYLIDGGFQGEDGERIKKYIEENAGKVKGWILTHPHVDHIGAFLDYVSQFPDRVEKVYYSPFTTEFFEKEEDPKIYQVLNNAILYYEFLALQDNTSHLIDYLPMKAGDSLMLEELKLECFASFDHARKDVNGNSLVFTLSYNDFTMLFTADMTEATLEAMKETAPADSPLWNVDVIQIPHHGYAGGITTRELYTLTGARLALLDCTRQEYDNNSAMIHNTTKLLEELEIPVLPRFLGEQGTRIFIYP